MAGTNQVDDGRNDLDKGPERHCIDQDAGVAEAFIVSDELNENPCHGKGQQVEKEGSAAVQAPGIIALGLPETADERKAEKGEHAVIKAKGDEPPGAGIQSEGQLQAGKGHIGKKGKDGQNARPGGRIGQKIQVRDVIQKVHVVLFSAGVVIWRMQ